MPKLIAGGDSFIYGSELTDCVDSQGQEQISQLTFPALIAKEAKLEYVCVARPGYSNAAIKRTVMNACEQYKDISLVIVSWSFTGRYEFRINKEWKQISPWTAVDDVKEIERKFQFDNPIVLQHHADELVNSKRSGLNEFAKWFYNNTDYVAEIHDTLSSIIMLQQYLTLHNISYIFTAADRSSIDVTIDDESIKTLQKQLGKLWGWFNNKGFYTWAQDMKFPFATTHPREEAHLEAAHIFYEHIRHFGWLP
jgi:hypothetical protein